MFINRIDELDFLENIYRKNKSQLIILYGRRRIGKTELLKQFSIGKKYLFFSCDLSSEHEQLKQFSEKIFQVTKDSFLKTDSFNSWEALLRYIFDHLPNKVPLIIIDEFPYLCISNKALPSIIQKIWDEKSKSNRIILILSGSYMSFMEKEILSYKSPLYGRRTGQMNIISLEYNVIKGFFPKYSKKDLIYTYAILGGTPAYLERFDNSLSIERNIKDEILRKNSYLYREPHFLLMEELYEPSFYFSILKAIAVGKTKLNEIVQELGITNRNKVSKYLSVLRELRIIRREVSITEKNPYQSKKGIYVFEDPFFRFWFRYIFPNFSYLEDGDINYVWNHKIKQNLDSFTGSIFEDICIQKLKKLNRINKLPFKFHKIGRWWDGKDEIDIVAYDEYNNYLFCECKWTNKKIGINLLNNLENKTLKFLNIKNKYFGFFSKNGFKIELIKLQQKRNDIILFDY